MDETIYWCSLKFLLALVWLIRRSLRFQNWFRIRRDLESNATPNFVDSNGAFIYCNKKYVKVIREMNIEKALIDNILGSSQIHYIF